MALDQRWKDTIENAVNNPLWDSYDAHLKSVVTGFNERLKQSPQYSAVPWNLAKAVLWVESGGPVSSVGKKLIANPTWLGKVMQIGNKGDPAYDVVLHQRENVKLVIDSSILIEPKIDDPKTNISFALTYLFQRHISGKRSSVNDLIDRNTYTYSVAPHDTLSKIALRVGTTVDVLERLNPGGTTVLRFKQVLKYNKASIKFVASGWTALNTESISRLYNGGGDPNYKEKLDYVISVFSRLKR
jgi:LysM domain